MTHDFNDVTAGVLAGQGGGTGWADGSTFTNATTEETNVVAGNLIAPASTNYAISQSGTAQHIENAGGAASAYRGLAAPTTSDADIWFSFIGSVNGSVSARTGLTFDAMDNGGRFLMRGLDDSMMEIFREPGGGANDYAMDASPFLMLGRLQLNPGGSDILSWWYNPDVTAIDPLLPDESYLGRNWDGDDGISDMGVTVYGAGPGALDAFRFSTGASAYQDVTGVAMPTSSVIQWAVDADGNYGDTANWSGGVVPDGGVLALFGNVVTDERVVTVDTNAEIGGLLFQAANGEYVLESDGFSALTLTGAATIEGQATINASIAGTSGLNKVGGGDLYLGGDNTYTGVTNVQAGILRATNINSINDDLNIETDALFVAQGFLDDEGEPLGGGFSGTFNHDITGDGTFVLSNSLLDEVIVFDSPKNFDGVYRISAGVMVVSDTGVFGTQGTFESRTYVGVPGDRNIGQLKLTNNITVADEILQFDARLDEEAEVPHLLSEGNNNWNGNVYIRDVGDVTIESAVASQTLQLGGVLTASDSAGTRNYIFSGAGNTNITGYISDCAADDLGELVDLINNEDQTLSPDGIADTNANNNINVIKRGTGTLTLSSPSSAVDHFWYGSTLVEEGTLKVVAGPGDIGELASPVIHVSEAATMDVSSFGVYNMQVGQTIGGAGQVTGNLGYFDDAILAPGDKVGTLDVAGNLSMTTYSSTPTGALKFKLGDSHDVDNGENDLIDVSGNVTANDALGSSGRFAVQITPQGTLASGTYTLIRAAGSLNGSATAASYEPTLVDADGELITNTRFALSMATDSDSVNLQVSGSAANLTWKGSTSAYWDINADPNWTGGSTRFMNLDRVTFDDSATGTTDVVVAQEVYAGEINFNNNTKNYTITGEAIKGTALVVLSGTGVVTLAIANSNYGSITAESGSTLEVGNEQKQVITIGGDLVAKSGSTIRIGGDGYVLSTPTVTGEDFEGFGPPATGVVFTGNAVTNTPSMSGWQLIDGRSSTSTQTGNDDAVFELMSGANGVSSSVSLNQTNANTDFPDTGNAHNGSMAISPLDASGAVDIVSATIGQSDPSGGYADASVVFGYVDQDNYFYAQVNQGYGISIIQVVDDTPQTLTNVPSGTTGNFANNVPWDVTLVHNATAGEVSFTASDGTSNYTVNLTNPALQTGGTGLIGFGSHNDAWTVDDVTVSTTDGIQNFRATVDGDFDLQLGATLAFDMNGLESYDSLSVTGDLILDGTLEVNLLDTFSGQAGDTFNLLNVTGTISGSPTLMLPALELGLVWDDSELLTEGMLAIVLQPLEGDFNGDGVVSIADYTVWRDNLGADTDDALNGNGDGIDGVTVADYDVWKGNFGATWAASLDAVGGAAVPEPTSIFLLVAATAALVVARRRAV
ncbi:beta strand repeat-containing protein [Aeoliella mucimassa]|uniref:beta strand repeat-containing protein n=1 Tax=Aeoliella mucimassa TaxID=2527972 RepID=UPI0018D337C0|nr:autotransporter-associated beta strand repeat-containing protein [Aeoliella mucimassa]